MLPENSLKWGRSDNIIRELSAYGAARKGEIGDENVFDFSIGNPSVPAPECVKQAVLEAMEQVGAVVEGYFAALSACQLSEKMGVEMPICQCAYDVLYRGESAAAVLERLMTRHRRHEVDESWI